MRDRYTAKYSGLKLSDGELDFLHRRTSPLLDKIGLAKPITHLLQEAYLQGVRDAVEVNEARQRAEAEDA